MSGPTSVIFDTDGGVDDASALWYGLMDPNLEVLAVTTVSGVVSAEQTARNMCKVLHAADRADIPVALGAEEPLGPAPDMPPATMLHGSDGLGDRGYPDAPFGPVDEAAVDLIARLVTERPDEITLVAVGPFTNIAHLVQRHPDLVAKVEELVIMGGAATIAGNATPRGEFNVACDPEGAQVMVDAGWRIPPLMVGLDVTLTGTMGAQELSVLDAEGSPAAEFMSAPFRQYRQLEALTTPTIDGSCASHDTLTMMAVAHPEMLTVEELPLQIDTGGSAAWGETVVDVRARMLSSGLLPEELVEMARAVFFEGKATWRIALDVDVEAFRRRIRAFYAGDIESLRT